MMGRLSASLVPDVVLEESLGLVTQELEKEPDDNNQANYVSSE